MSATILTNCTTSNKKIEAQNKEQNAKANLKQYLAMKESVLQYKNESAEKTIAYESQLASYTAKTAYDKKETKIKYEKKLAEIEQNNNEMIKRVNNFQDTAAGKDNFELFKYELSREMHEQSNSIKASNI